MKAEIDGLVAERGGSFPAVGGSPVRTGARAVLLREGFQAFRGLPTADGWVADGNRIVFHGRIGDSSNTWQIAMSPRTWQVNGAPQRVTFGTTDEGAASVTSDGRMVFTSRTIRADLWSLPIDADRGKVQGLLKRVTEDLADDYDPTLSADGEKLAFRSRRAGQFDVLIRDLRTGAETFVTQTPADDYPVISPDGTEVAYSFRQDGKTPIFVVAADGGASETACPDCGVVEQWAPTGEILFATADDPSAVGIVKVGPSPDRGWLEQRGC